MLSLLLQRELGKPFPTSMISVQAAERSSSAGALKNERKKSAVSKVVKNIDSLFNDMVDTVNELRKAMDSARIREVEAAVQLVMKRLLHANSANIDDVYVVTPSKKEEREVFVALGGMHQLLRFFEKPFGDKGKGAAYMLQDRDYRLWLHQNSQVWVDVLVILREVLLSLPALSEGIFSTHHVCFLFTLLAHESTFEHAANLLEDVLAVKTELFSLASVPHLHVLLDKLHARQTAHFCKILSLVLFEPEDRQIIEGSQVLRGVELLSLRRDRLLKPNGIVERNQSIIIEAPQFLERLVQVLRIVNYGPGVGDIIEHDIISQSRSPVPNDLLKFATSKFADYSRLEEAARQERGSPSESGDAGDPPLVIEEDITSKLLEAFSPSERVDGDHSRLNEVTTITNVMKLALKMGLATVTPNGQQLLMWAASALGNEDPVLELQTLVMQMATSSVHSFRDGYGASGRGGGGAGARSSSASHELQFHALLLAPYQIDVLFVLCTLLTGRRKIDIQGMLAGMQLASVLLKACERMSWYTSPPPFEHPHCPGCECNPASALRVQYLRLVHNFFDSDFLFSANKQLLLSGAERALLRAQRGRSLLQHPHGDRADSVKGLVSQLALIHQSDKVEMPYKFWLSLCLEAFVRGSTGPEQLLLTRNGMINSVLNVITSFSAGQTVLQALQSAFDLLGELVRRNPLTIAVLNSSLDDRRFSQFMDTAVHNLVQSNVFLTSMYISLELLDVKARGSRGRPVPAAAAAAATEGGEASTADGGGSTGAPATAGRAASEPPTHYGYLTHSWFKFAPKPLSHRAIACTRGQDAFPACARAAAKQPVRVDAALAPAGGSLHGTKVVYPSSQSLLSQGTRAPPRIPGDKEDDVHSLSRSKKMERTGHTDPSELDDAPDEPVFFGTPPEAPGFLGQRLAEEGREAATKPKPKPKAKTKAAGGGAGSIMSDLPALDGAAGWAANDEVFRLGVFLTEERDNILLRLMDVVTIRTINHENICCLNTTLTLLLLVQRRGQGHLAGALANIRQLADKRVARAKKSFSYPMASSSSSSSSPSPSEYPGGARGCPPCLGHGYSNSLAECGGGEKIMTNFRQLLWFWREYYLRRGRDRLSVEFTTRIRFPYWVQLVDLLCADDGSPTALLRAPCTIIRSPYLHNDGTGRPFSLISAAVGHAAYE